MLLSLSRFDQKLFVKLSIELLERAGLNQREFMLAGFKIHQS